MWQCHWCLLSLCLNPLHLSQRVGCKGKMTGYRTDAVYKASRTAHWLECNVCGGHIISKLSVCLCMRTFRSELSSHSYFDAAALRFLQHRTKEWQREMARHQCDTEQLWRGVTQWQPEITGSVSVFAAVHHFSISIPILLCAYGREGNLQRNAKQRCQKVTKQCKNCTNGAASTGFPGPYLKTQISHPQPCQASSPCCSAGCVICNDWFNLCETLLPFAELRGVLSLR